METQIQMVGIADKYADQRRVLKLSDYERGYLEASFWAHLEMQEYKSQYSDWYEHLKDEENEWLAVVVGDRSFDLCISLNVKFDAGLPDEPPEYKYPQGLVCVAYEMHPELDGMGNPTGDMSTDTSLEHFIKEAKS